MSRPWKDRVHRVKYPYGNLFLKNRFEVRGEDAVLFLKRVSAEDLECFIEASDLAVVALSGICFSSIWNAKSQTFYAGGYLPRKRGEGAKKTYIYLHRLVTNAPEGSVVDHWDHNGLNNRKTSNLRVVSHTENLLNRRGATSRSASQIRGVRFREDIGRWSAEIKLDGIARPLGAFDTAEEAKAAFDYALKTRTFPDTTPRGGTVYFDKQRNKWSAQYRTAPCKAKSIGRFATKELAESALAEVLNATVQG